MTATVRPATLADVPGSRRARTGGCSSRPPSAARRRRTAGGLRRRRRRRSSPRRRCPPTGRAAPDPRTLRYARKSGVWRSSKGKALRSSPLPSRTPRSHGRSSPRRSLFPPPASASASSPPPNETREKLRRVSGRIVVEMWRVMVVVYQLIHAALVPMRLRDLPRFIDVFLEHVGRRNEKKRPKQTERFLPQLDPRPPPPPPSQDAPFASPSPRASPLPA